MGRIRRLKTRMKIILQITQEREHWSTERSKLKSEVEKLLSINKQLSKKFKEKQLSASVSRNVLVSHNLEIYKQFFGPSELHCVTRACHAIINCEGNLNFSILMKIEE